jgi:hypothetical protein
MFQRGLEETRRIFCSAHRTKLSIHQQQITIRRSMISVFSLLVLSSCQQSKVSSQQHRCRGRNQEQTTWKGRWGQNVVVYDMPNFMATTKRNLCTRYTYRQECCCLQRSPPHQAHVIEKRWFVLRRYDKPLHFCEYGYIYTKSYIFIHNLFSRLGHLMLLAKRGGREFRD